MKDRLSAIAVAIYHGAIPRVSKPERASNIFCGKKQTADQFGIIGGQIIERLNMDFGDDENMHRCNGVNVMEGKNFVGAQDLFRWDAFCGNFAKDAIFVVE